MVTVSENLTEKLMHLLDLGDGVRTADVGCGCADAKGYGPDPGRACASARCASSNSAIVGVAKGKSQLAADYLNARLQATRDLQQALERGGLVVRKAWGWSCLLHECDNYQMWLCRAERGYSSNHYHTFLANSLVVVSGCIDVLYDDRHVGSEVCRLTAGESLFLLPRENHRLVVVEPGYFIETYRSSLASESPDYSDIVRLDEGSSEDWKP